MRIKVKEFADSRYSPYFAFLFDLFLELFRQRFTKRLFELLDGRGPGILGASILQVSMIILKLSELEVTYTEGSEVFHRSNCRAQQRIRKLERTSRREAIGMGLKPCLNCERNSDPPTQH